MRALWITVVGLTLILAGCLGPNEDEGLSAWSRADGRGALSGLEGTEGLDLDDMDLLAVLGLEMGTRNDTRLGRLGNDEVLGVLTASTDEAQGDGHAPAWVYLYATDSGKLLVVAQSQGGATSALMDADRLPGILRGLEGGAPLGDDWIDSTEASGHVRASDASWHDKVGDQEGSVVMVLHHPAHLDAPVWGFAFWSADDAVSALFVDATTGGAVDRSKVHPESGVTGGDSVTLLPPEPTEYEISVEPPYRGLVIRIQESGNPNPASHVHAWLIDPAGNDVSVDDAGWPEPIVIRQSDAMTGTYTLRLGSYSDMDAAILPEVVDVDWCLDGPLPDPLQLHGAPGACLSKSDQTL